MWPRMACAIAVALPVGFVVWVELLYLAFGIVGGDPPRLLYQLTLLAALATPFAWSLRGALRPADVVWRGCRLGILVAMLLPVVAVVVLLIWENASGRPDLGMGGLMLYSMPVVAFVAAAVLVPVFWIGRRWAERRIGAKPGG